MTQLFLSFLITSAVGTLLALLLTLLRPITRKLFSASWNYYVWLVVLLVMMVPVRLTLPKTESTLVTVQITEVKESESPHKEISGVLPQISENVINSEVLTENNVPNSLIQNYEPKKKNSTPVFQTAVEFLKDNTVYFAQAWIVGAVLLFMIKIAGYKKFLANILKNSRQVPCAEIGKYTDEKIDVRVSGEVQSPFVIRWLKPVLILPDREITRGEMKNILSHEMTHIKRHDILYKWFVSLVKCVHWFNPFVYLIARQIDVECEVSCDAQAVRNMNLDEKKTYAETILSLLADKGKRVAFTTGMSGDKKILKKRFEMIKNSKITTKRIMVVSVILIVVILGVTLLVSGILNGELFGEEIKRRIPVSESEEETGLNIVNEKDININPYDKVLEKYYRALNEKWDHNKMWNENLVYLAGLSKHENPIENIGYCLMDLNGDGQEELLIGEITDGYWGKVIYDLYVIKNGETYILLRSHERSRHILFEENGVYKIALEGTESAAKAFTNYYAFNGNSLKFEKAVILDGTKHPESEVFTSFFLAYDDDFNTENDTPIDQKTAMEIMQSYEEKYITPEFIPFATLKEEATSVSEEEAEKIIEKFYAADDFWRMWVYGQNYVTDRMSSSQNMYYGAVDSDSPIQTKEELKAAFETYFTKSLAEEFMKFLNPEDIDGKLYIAYGDVGDNGEALDNVTVRKVNDNKYELTLDMTQFFEDRKYTKKVYYVFEDDKWVFENDVMGKYFFHWQKHENIEYLPVMKKYYLAMLEEWEWEKIDEHELVDIISAFHGVEPLKRVGYSLMDVNNDGQNELLIGKVEAQDKIVWDMYSVKNGQAYRVLVSGDRNRHYIFKNEGKYMVANERHGSATDYEYTYSDFDGEKLNTEKSIIYVGDNLPDNPWFMDGEPVDEKEAMRIRDGYWEKYISIEFIPFETLE